MWALAEAVTLTGAYNDRATHVPPHPVWPKTSCTLFVTNVASGGY
jgi:hypothetical protein